ncbi:MAG: hypothetical protein B6D70_12560 [gamma proteobacterium symbiont of Stewartia floridana]|nr:DUF1501 domain-containing protein [Candidatus Thiodiazotropha taylori]MCG7961822.1 DUF1501 domain-containing protein [Candidatus Thiodiazotropha endolucinida]RLW53510.1 MAG: hypothetical protein B6D76_11515 [gamma proteobacterium symbiont of Stewartia floridana]MCG7893654.1 DUF1501 domain-containing protein [Candidatus Thiodiazotropha taylori]MCG7908181.1 DUF1501 domain-containing protein [Candidatus Thiodiazotropha taylori]
MNGYNDYANRLPTDKDLLVCLFQRGAADGLNSLVPYTDSEYYSQRSNIAVPEPGAQGGAIDLDGRFALHPALAPLKAIYDSGQLALIHATGIPHNSRSHFVAQDIVERGVSAKPLPSSGWLGRHLSLDPVSNGSAFRIVSISGNVPVSLHGASEPLAISNLSEFGFSQEIIDSGYTEVLGNLFDDQIPFAAPAQAALSALTELQAAELESILPEHGASYPDTELGKKMQQTAQLIKSNLPVEVICIDAGGWDHHENLPGNLQQSLTDLADSLSAFHTDMADLMQQISLFVMTEFGRRVAENASVGTDHGTGGVAYAMGGGVNGGQVITDWPGLSTADLHFGEDLAITTDLRTLLAELLNKRLGGTDLAQVFPGFAGPTTANLFLD